MGNTLTFPAHPAHDLISGAIYKVRAGQFQLVGSDARAVRRWLVTQEGSNDERNDFHR